MVRVTAKYTFHLREKGLHTAEEWNFEEEKRLDININSSIDASSK